MRDFFNHLDYHIGILEFLLNSSIFLAISSDWKISTTFL